MTAVEESPILIPSEDEDDDDDIVVVKEEKIPITIDETEDADQDGEVIFVAQTSAPSAIPWGRSDPTSSHLHLISEKETSTAAAAIATSPDLSAISSVSASISPTPCSANLSSMAVEDDLGEGHETKSALHRNLSLASAVEFSLSLEDSDQSPLDLSKNRSGVSKTGASVDLTVLSSHRHASQYVASVNSSTFDDSSNGSISFDRVGATSTNPSVLVAGSSQGGLHSDVSSVPLLADPFAIPSSSQTVISSQVGQLGVTDTSNTPAVLAGQNLKVTVGSSLQDQSGHEATTLQAATILMNIAAASTSSQMAGGSNLPSATSGGSGGHVKLSPAPTTSTDTNTQLLANLDFLMQDDTLSQVLNTSTTCTGVSQSSAHSHIQATSQVTPAVVTSVPYLAPSSSNQPAVISTKPVFIKTKPEDLTSAGATTQNLCVPGVRLLVGLTADQQSNNRTTQTLSFQPQAGCSSGNGVSVSPTLDFAQILAQVLDQQSVGSSTGSTGPTSTVISSSASSSTSLIASTAVSSSLPSTLPSSSLSSTRTLYSDASNVPSQQSAKVTVPASVCSKRLSTNSISTLDASSLPPRKRVRSLIESHSFSGSSTSSPQLVHTGKSASFSGIPVSSDKNVSASDQGSSAFTSHASSVGADANSATTSTSTAVSSSLRVDDGGACERCQNGIIGTQLSRCTQGHRACGQCLEEQVKLVLTGRQKGSLKCIASNCSSYYPMSELKHSLPNMVVEILEDKLDRDYVEYISDMMLSNATAGTTTTTTATTPTTPASSPSPTPSTSKSSAEVQTSDNSDVDDNTNNADDNDNDNDADESADETDDTSSCSSVSSSASRATIKRKVAVVTRFKKLLPASSSSSLSSLSDDAGPNTATAVDVEDDENEEHSMSEEEEDTYGDLTDDYEDNAGQGEERLGRGDTKEGGATSQDSRDERHKDLPENWAKMDNNMTLLAVPLKPDSEEYIEVAIRFHTTMTFPQADITKILRIQNPIMWKYYSLKRLEMVQENDGLSVEEKMLFHGTKCSVIDAICRKGFDWRVCGKHGTAYGHGCYFALDSIYSHNYTDRTMDVGQVSVVLRSVSASSNSQSQDSGSSSSSHLTPASVNLSSLNPQPSGSSGSSLSSLNPQPSGSSGSSHHQRRYNILPLASETWHPHRRMAQQHFFRRILARINPVMYQSSANSAGQPMQGMSSHPPAYPKPLQPIAPKPNGPPKQGYPPPASGPSAVLGGGVPASSLQAVHNVVGVKVVPARQPPSSTATTQQPSGSGLGLVPDPNGSGTNPKPVPVMMGPYQIPKNPSSQPGGVQPLQGPGIVQQSAGAPNGLVSAFSGSLPGGGGVMVGGQGSAHGPVAGPGSGFALGPMSSTHSSLLFLSRQPPVAPPPPPPHPFSHIPHSHQQPRAHSSHLPPWVRLPAGPSHAHAITEPGKYCSGTRYMFLAKVLVGRSTGGCSGYRRPPPLDPNEPFGKCYDSCVDNIFDPKIFVVFDSNQAYPEYIIEYKFVE